MSKSPLATVPSNWDIVLSLSQTWMVTSLGLKLVSLRTGAPPSILLVLQLVDCKLWDLSAFDEPMPCNKCIHTLWTLYRTLTNTDVIIWTFSSCLSALFLFVRLKRRDLCWDLFCLDLVRFLYWRPLQLHVLDIWDKRKPRKLTAVLLLCHWIPNCLPSLLPSSLLMCILYTAPWLY